MTEPLDWSKLRLWALRGATTVERNDAEEILVATEELLSEVIDRNGLKPQRMVSCLFTCTDDLDAEFPAVAARRLGLDAVPLLCTREIAVPNALPKVIRVMVHCYGAPELRPEHVYLREAVQLRSDLSAPQ